MRVDVVHVAALAHLPRDPETTAVAAGEVERMLRFVASLPATDPEDSSLERPPDKTTSVLDADRPEAVETPWRENAPRYRDDCFVVPRVRRPDGEAR
ncbi:MAG: hypothetical protein AAGD38_04425 [Acidobacteriota bacterium]